jgi:hypothetical protein
MNLCFSFAADNSVKMWRLLLAEDWWQADYCLSAASVVTGCSHSLVWPCPCNTHFVSTYFDTPRAVALQCNSAFCNSALGAHMLLLLWLFMLSELKLKLIVFVTDVRIFYIKFIVELDIQYDCLLSCFGFVGRLS